MGRSQGFCVLAILLRMGYIIRDCWRLFGLRLQPMIMKGRTNSSVDGNIGPGRKGKMPQSPQASAYHSGKRRPGARPGE
jgi:hypothetical protein